MPASFLKRGNTAASGAGAVPNLAILGSPAVGAAYSNSRRLGSSRCETMVSRSLSPSRRGLLTSRWTKSCEGASLALAEFPAGADPGLAHSWQSGNCYRTRRQERNHTAKPVSHANVDKMQLRRPGAQPRSHRLHLVHDENFKIRGGSRSVGSAFSSTPPALYSSLQPRRESASGR
jgi:hypothetical protein